MHDAAIFTVHLCANHWGSRPERNKQLWTEKIKRCTEESVYQPVQN